MNLNQALTFLRRNIILIVAGMLLGGVAGLLVALIQVPKYQATAQVFVSLDNASTASDLSQGAAFTQQIVRSYATVATSPLVLNYVIDRLKLQDNATSLANDISISVPDGEVVITIDVLRPSASESAAIANAISTRLTSVVEDFSPTRVNSTPSVRLTQITAAIPPARPATPNIPLVIVIATFVGLAIGVISGVARSTLDIRFRSAEEVGLLAHLPSIGQIPFESSLRAQNSPKTVEQNPALAEAFRVVATNLDFLTIGAPLPGVLITSAESSDGKSTTACNLALALASSQKRVVLVEADMRRPKVSDYLGLIGEIGLSDVLAGRASLQLAVQSSKDSTLSVLPSGSIPPNPGELLQTAAFAKVLQDLGARYDWVLIDAPPVMAVADATILARLVGGVIVVAAVGKTGRSQFLNSLTRLRQVEARLYGVLPTMIKRRGGRSDGYYYAYSQMNRN